MPWRSQRYGSMVHLLRVRTVIPARSTSTHIGCRRFIHERCPKWGTHHEHPQSAGSRFGRADQVDGLSAEFRCMCCPSMGGMPWQWVAPDAGCASRAARERCRHRSPQGLSQAFHRGHRGARSRPDDSRLQEINRVAGKPGLRAVHLPNSMADQVTIFSTLPITRCCRAAKNSAIRCCFIRSTGKRTFMEGRTRLGGSAGTRHQSQQFTRIHV